MVTKLLLDRIAWYQSSVLAKIHMVTKLCWQQLKSKINSVLAKIHMVTKLGSTEPLNA